MIFKRGSVGKIVALLLAVFVLVMVILALVPQYGNFVFFGSLANVTEFTAPSGVSIVGIKSDDIYDDNLYYFTGERWRAVENSVEDFKVSTLSFDVEEMRSGLRDFSRSERRPESFVVDARNWRYWDIDQIGSGASNTLDGVYIVDRKKNGFVGPEKTYLSLESNGRLREVVGNNYIPIGFSSDFLTNFYSDAVVLVDKWRDQIYEGNECEKYLDVEILEEGKESFVEKHYSVGKQGSYTFVDLQNPVLDVESQKWNDEGCFNVTSYSEEDRSDWSNGASLLIEFTESRPRWYQKDVRSKIWWIPGSGWQYESEDSNWERYKLDDSRVPWQYRLYGEDRSSFYRGFQKLISEDEGINNLRAYNLRAEVSSKEVSLERVLDSERSLSNDESRIGAFEFSVLDLYNSYFVPSVRINPVRLDNSLGIFEIYDSVPSEVTSNMSILLDDFPGKEGVFVTPHYRPQFDAGVAIGRVPTDDLRIRIIFSLDDVSDNFERELLDRVEELQAFVILYDFETKKVRGGVGVDRLRVPQTDSPKVAEFIISDEVLKQAGVSSGRHGLDVIVYDKDKTSAVTIPIEIDEKFGGALNLELDD